MMAFDHHKSLINCLALRPILSSATQPTKQTTHMHAIYPSTLIALSLTLTACGGGDDTSANPAPSPDSPSSTELSGNLSIKINNQTAKTIQTRTTSEDTEYPAYQVTTTLSSEPFKASTFESPNLSHTQTLDFWLDNQGQTKISADIDPVSQQLIGLTLQQKSKNGTTSIEDKFSCTKSLINPNGCQNVSFSIAAQTGRAALNFGQTSLQQSNGADTATLNGTLIGELSRSPQNLNSIPKTSQASLSIDGKSVEVIASTYTPNFDQIELLLNDKQLMSVSLLSNQTSQSSLQIISDTATTNYRLQNSDQISTQSTATQATLTFNKAQYQASSNISVPPKTLSGEVTLRKPIQTLSVSPWFKSQTNARNSTPNRINVSVINHQEVMLSANDLIVQLRNGQIDFVEFIRIEQDFSDESAPYVLVYYQCKKTACQGIQVEPNGFGVKFNNTTLTRVGNEDALNPTITLNGGLIYLGR